MKKVISFVLMAASMALSIFGCSPGNEPLANRKTFVLVHGAWQGAFVWEAVKEALEKKKQKVIVVELPAHGEDFTAPAAVSMDVYRDKVMEAVKNIKGQIILVGHSMGGVVITAVAEKIPGKIEKLIYVGAFVPANGQSLADLAFSDKQSLLGPSLIPSKDQLTLDVVRENVTNIFCQDAPATVQAALLKKFRVEPAIPFGDKITLSSNFAGVDKYYIHTVMDHAIGMDLQNRMVEGAHITKMFSINTGHSPFLSKPGELTDMLLTISQQ